MQRISTHIEKLLLFNDCVIVPDFGGFVLQMHPAVYVSLDHMFSPPYKDIVFNPTLKHNDGLLSESYMQTYGMDFNEAQAAVKQDVDTLKKELNENGSVLLGTIGSFRKNNESLIFEPSIAVTTFNLASYGLTSFYLPPIELASNERQVQLHVVNVVEPSIERVSEPIAKSSPIPKFFSRIAGIAAAAIAIFLLISTPVKDVNTSAYTASFIPSEMVLQQYPVQKESIDEDSELVTSESSATIIAESGLISSVDASMQPSSSDGTTDIKTQSSSKPVIELVTAKTYYVIVASFQTETQLNKYLSNTDLSTLKNMGVVKNSERIRVYADKTNIRKDAEAYIDLLRENGKYKDAWLFIGR
ncbi:MAG: SPOR domain-containing protein [Tannerella sp.]|nr:SPOR domain-containing protein [Tannerella sp.]